MNPDLERVIRMMQGPRGVTIRPTGPRLNEATADSIYTALGEPESTPQIGFIGGGTGRFITEDRGITLSRALADREAPSTLVHELGHQESPLFGIEDPNPDFVSLRNIVFDRFSEADPQAQLRLLRAYGFADESIREQAEQHNVSIEDIADIKLGGANSIEREEVMSTVLQKGFDLARHANQVEQPEMGRLVEAADEYLPGIREVFNFFIQRFPEGPIGDALR